MVLAGWLASLVWTIIIIYNTLDQICSLRSLLSFSTSFLHLLVLVDKWVFFWQLHYFVFYITVVYMLRTTVYTKNIVMFCLVNELHL